MKLPRIYTHFSQGQVFTIEEACHKLGSSGNTLRKRLSDLTMRGYISSIRQGLYRLSELDESRYAKNYNSPLEIVSKLSINNYIGYKSALLFHAYGKIPENQQIYTISKTKFNSFNFDTRKYIWCQSSESYGVESYSLETKFYKFSFNITNIEKTLLDCLKRPYYCNNMATLLSLCHKLSTPPNLDLLMQYALRMNIRSVFNRLGYLLETKKEDWQISDDLLLKLEELMSQKQIEWNISVCESQKNRWKINFAPLNYSKNSHSDV